MPMRMTGLISGMDTESVIKDLVKVRQSKVDKAKKAQTKLEWKTEAWKELNTKLKNLHNKYAANLRWSTSYTKLKTEVSDKTKADVITGEGAVGSVQNLRIKQLAKTAYFTGADVSKAHDGEKYTALSKVSDLLDNTTKAKLEDGGEIKFKLTSGVENINEVEIKITSETTVSDVLNQMKEAGINANFDEKTQRFFLSAKESGKEGNIALEAIADGEDDYTASNAVLKNLGLVDVDANNKTTYVDGKDAIIYLNDAEFSGSTNVFEINGLTITALNETADNESVTLTTKQDTDGIYDMIKNFFKEYNKVINEMDKLYNADRAKDMEPLTDEEKEEMSDSEIEKWEKKVKDSLLRRDDSLYSILDGLKTTFSKGVEMSDGTTMYLSEFGIGTLGYFDAPDNEKNAYHIDGDPDDGDTSGKTDKLKSAIANDPEKVVSFFSKLFNNVYMKMNDLSKSVEGTRSFGSFYNDKKMKTDYDSYKSKITDLESQLNDYEDKWYKKFAAMETALAKLQSNTSAVTGLLGQ